MPSSELRRHAVGIDDSPIAVAVVRNRQPIRTAVRRDTGPHDAAFRRRNQPDLFPSCFHLAFLNFCQILLQMRELLGRQPEQEGMQGPKGGLVVASERLDDDPRVIAVGANTVRLNGVPNSSPGSACS